MTPIHDPTSPPGPAPAVPAGAPRVDFYGPVHTALRRAMAQTLQELGARDVSQADARLAVLDSLDSLLALLRSHVAQEEDFVHTAIEARLPGGTRQLADQHLQLLESIGHLADESRAVRHAPNAQHPLLVQRLRRHLAAFVDQKLAHMQAEEARGHALLWALYADEDLLNLQHRLAAPLSEPQPITPVHTSTLEPLP